MINLEKPPTAVASARKRPPKGQPAVAIASSSSSASSSDSSVWAASADVAGDVAETLLSSTPHVISTGVLETVFEGAGEMLSGAGEVFVGLAEGAADLGSALAEGLADLLSGL